MVAGSITSTVFDWLFGTYTSERGLPGDRREVAGAVVGVHVGRLLHDLWIRDDRAHRRERAGRVVTADELQPGPVGHERGIGARREQVTGDADPLADRVDRDDRVDRALARVLPADHEHLVAEPGRARVRERGRKIPERGHRARLRIELEHRGRGARRGTRPARDHEPPAGRAHRGVADRMREMRHHPRPRIPA